jgi:aspartyl-tRNA(Asn)/glutamyl-tRNA(Gln) amidotransferase subunit C
MATIEEVQKLAALARIEVKPEELEKFTKEFDAILAYVGQLEKLEFHEVRPRGRRPRGRPRGEELRMLRNIFREDTNPTESGTWTERLIKAFPEKENNYLVVKQIISHD